MFCIIKRWAWFLYLTCFRLSVWSCSSGSDVHDKDESDAPHIFQHLESSASWNQFLIMRSIELQRFESAALQPQDKTDVCDDELVLQYKVLQVFPPCLTLPLNPTAAAKWSGLKHLKLFCNVLWICACLIQPRYSEICRLFLCSA